MGLPRELHSDLVNPAIAAPVVVVALTLDVTETADVTVAAFKAVRKMKLIGASYHHESAATAVTSYTCQLSNGGTAMSDALDIKAIGADAGADFAGIPTGSTSELADGDVLDVIFNETGGTVTAPDRVGILLEFQLLK